MNCTHCDNNYKYKCPTCRQPYCSVACYKIHKENPCAAPTPPQTDKSDVTKKSTYEYEYPTEDTVPLDKLRLLEGSMELKKCLENPHVREMLKTLDKSYDPDSLIQEYMTEPIFY
ncbi:unnamed protein product, partial [Iphiclides podalirius]